MAPFEDSELDMAKFIFQTDEISQLLAITISYYVNNMLK